jgi:hypothetical protein
MYKHDFSILVIVINYFISSFFFRNFPTAENIARKNTMLAEKKARGEVIQTKYFG